MPRHADRGLLISLLVVILLIVLWYISTSWKYRNTLFSPSRMSQGELSTPDEYGGRLVPKREFQNVYIGSGDGYVHANVYNNYPDSNFVIFCHGNSGTIADRGYMVELTQLIRLNLIVFDYRGFGESKGTMNEKTILEDAESVYKYTRFCDVDVNRIILWGESLGGSPAVHLARNHPCLKLVLMFAFASLRDVAIYSEIPDYLRSAITTFLLNSRRNLPNKVWIRDVNVPVLIIHSVDDDMVNIENAKILYDSIRHHRKTILYIKGAHSNPEIDAEAFKFMSVFLQARNEEPFLATDSEIEKMDRVLKYYNVENNKVLTEDNNTIS